MPFPRKITLRRVLTTALLCAAAGLAGFLIYRAVTRYGFSEIVASLSKLPPRHLFLAACFAAASYVCLTGFDTLAVRYVGRSLSYRQTALASFTALSLGHNIGFAALSSGAIRYRFYRRWGLTTGETAQIIIFCGVTVGLGLSTVGGTALLAQNELAERISGLRANLVIWAGCGLLLVPVAYLLLSVSYKGQIGFRKWTMKIPAFSLAAGQVVIGTTNFAMVAACLHQTLVAVEDISFASVASIYAIANATAIASHAPGGLGVIESVVIFVLPGASVLAALIAFRVIYFFIPLALGSITFVVSELFLQSSRRAPRSQRV